MQHACSDRRGDDRLAKASRDPTRRHARTATGGRGTRARASTGSRQRSSEQTVAMGRRSGTATEQRAAMMVSTEKRRCGGVSPAAPKRGRRTWGGRVRRGKLLYVRKYQDHRFLPPLSRLAWPRPVVPNHNKQRQAIEGGGGARKAGSWLDHPRRMACTGHANCQGLCPAPVPRPALAKPTRAARRLLVAACQLAGQASACQRVRAGWDFLFLGGTTLAPRRNQPLRSAPSLG